MCAALPRPSSLTFSWLKRPASWAGGALLAGWLGAALPTEAQTSPVQLTQVGPASLRLRIAGAAWPTGHVQITSLTTGQTLFESSYQQGEYGRRFDFDHLPTSCYALRLRVGPTRYRYLVKVQTIAAYTTVISYQLKTSLAKKEGILSAN